MLGIGSNGKQLKSLTLGPGFFSFCVSQSLGIASKVAWPVVAGGEVVGAVGRVGKKAPHRRQQATMGCRVLPAQPPLAATNPPTCERVGTARADCQQRWRRRLLVHAGRGTTPKAPWVVVAGGEVEGAVGRAGETSPCGRQQATIGCLALPVEAPVATTNPRYWPTYTRRKCKLVTMLAPEVAFLALTWPRQSK